MATIGLIAGGGRFPLLFAESARRAGHRVVAVAHRNETDPALAEKVDAITWVKLGQIGHLLEALKAGGATQTVMLGAITKRRFFADAMLDATGLRVLARVAIRSDDNLLRAIARFLEEVPDLPELHPREGVDLLGQGRVGLVPVRDRHDAVARAARALCEEEGEPPAARDEADDRHATG